jgi:TonB family protein
VLCAALLLTTTARAQEAPDIQNPVLLQRPNAADFAQNYPSQAIAQSVEGRATIECFVHLDTTLTCRVIAESPASWGFGDATLAIARSFRVEPARMNGEPVEGGRIRQTIRFVMPDETTEDLDPDARALREAMPPPDLPTWDDAPGSSLVLAATPEAARAAGTRGRGVLSCRVRDDRRLRCEPLLEAPTASGFSDAAMTLVPHFRVSENDAEFVARHTSEPFLLPINFGNNPEFTPVSRDYAGVGPINFPTVQAPPEIFPESARTAGIRSGHATVLCTSRNGEGLDCTVESETPADGGFGAIVLEFTQLIPNIPLDAGLIAGDQFRITVEFRPD